MNSMTFQKNGEYIVAYINGKEMGRCKLSKIGLSEEDIMNMIEANPEDEATETLNKIKLFNTIYEISTGTTYTAGTNIQISEEGVISATDTKYTAGTGITIENGVISSTSAGNPIYKHTVACTHSQFQGTMYIEIINNSNTPIDMTWLQDAINEPHNVYGMWKKNTTAFWIGTLITFSHNTGNLVIYAYGRDDNNEPIDSWLTFSTSYVTVTDNITQLS